MSTTYSDPSLFQQAQDQVNADISQQTGPLEGQIGSLNAEQQNASNQLQSMFGQILPAVQQSATAVKSAYDAAQKSAQAIFGAATQRLNALQQQRAQEAQTLAQKIGGPVAVGLFTEAVTPDQQYLAAAAPADLMNLQNTEQAGVEQAQAFAGRVFPLIRTEQEAKVQSYYEGQRAQVRDQIAQLNAGKSSLINSRYADLLKNQQDFQLQKSQLALDKLKSDRDWKATLRTLHNEDVKLTLARRAQAADITHTKKADLINSKQVNAEIAHMTESDRQNARQLGLSEQEYALKVLQTKQNAALALRQQQLSETQFAAQLVDAATGAGGTKTITQTVTNEVDQHTGLLNKNAFATRERVSPDTPGAQKGDDGNYYITHYYIDRKVTVPVSTPGGMKDPQQLFNYLVGYNIPPAMAANLVRSKLNKPGWRPKK